MNFLTLHDIQDGNLHEHQPLDIGLVGPIHYKLHTSRVNDPLHCLGELICVDETNPGHMHPASVWATIAMVELSRLSNRIRIPGRRDEFRFAQCYHVSAYVSI